MSGVARAVALAMSEPSSDQAVSAYRRLGTVPGHFRFTTQGAPPMQIVYATAAARNRYIVLNTWQTDILAAIKAANPGCICLCYKDLTYSATTSQNGYISTGVSYQEADPSWFQTKSGTPFLESGFAHSWTMNPGSLGYQARWLSNVKHDLQTLGYDGVFMDDTNATMKGGGGADYLSIDQFAGTQPVADALFQTATASMLAAVCPPLQSAGFLCCGNMGRWNDIQFGFNLACDNYMAYCDLGVAENFVKQASTPQSPTQGFPGENTWISMIRSVQKAEQAGKGFLGMSHSVAGDTTNNRYCYASYLLGANSARGGFMFSEDNTNGFPDGYSFEPPWIPEYDYAIGTPTEDMQGSSGQIRSRHFTNGLVVVNPTIGSLTATFGGVYSDVDAGVTSQTSVVMPSCTGLVLTLG